MIDYPNKLEIIFDKLDKFSIKPIIVGGYIRDYFLNIESKDIDIELYGVDNLDIVEDILLEFGTSCSVGKSFGVCKFSYLDLDIDFSLPRSESKVGLGHRGFNVTTDKNLDFKTAASRRDFTINAMGFDVISKRLLDPYSGKKDLTKRVLKEVNPQKFKEDPLRILRAAGFSARFHLNIDITLLTLCKDMVNNGALEELPQERVFTEFEKFLLKSERPSIAIKVLKSFHAFSFFGEFHMYESIDYFALHKKEDKKDNLIIFFSLLYLNRSLNGIEKVLKEKKLLHNITIFLQLKKSISLDSISDYELYKLATKVNIALFFDFLDAVYSGSKSNLLDNLLLRAKRLGILHKKAEALIQGKDLLKAGLKPSPAFKDILYSLYEAQMKGVFTTKEAALNSKEFASLFEAQ